MATQLSLIIVDLLRLSSGFPLHLRGMSTERGFTEGRPSGTMESEVMDMDCGKVGELIRRLRLEQGMTQRQLADQLNLSDKTVSKWERGVSQS